MSFCQKISRFIDSEKLLKKDGKYLVGLSGGADSTALVVALSELGYAIEAAHCNFRLRGDEALRDEQFCVSLCQKYDIPIHIAHFDTREYAAGHKIGIEMAARELRYNFFRQLKRDIGAAAICIAHHSDDSAETVLINLVRGTGIEGLCGIKPLNGDIVRPLLCVSREEIEQYLKEKKQTYIVDSTNLSNDTIRNKIRLDVIPLLETINPSVKSSILTTAEHIAEAVKVVRHAMGTSIPDIMKSHDGRAIIDIGKLKKQPSPEYTLYFILKDYGFTSAQITEIWQGIDAQPGTEYVSQSHQLAVDRGVIIVDSIGEKADVDIKMPETGTYIATSKLKIKVESIARTADFTISKDSNICCIDARNVVFPLHLRNVKAGDRFVPFGMTGSKLVSDYLTDGKMNILDKRRQLLIADDKGRILWIVGLRTDNRFRVTADTVHVIRMTAIRQ